MALIAALSLGLLAAYLFWRHIWFFRNPQRHPPAAEGILSPADGTVVYVRRAAPHEEVVVIKKGLAATIRDILRQDVAAPKIVVGIFMSPFDVHYNRALIKGHIGMIRHYPAEGENLYMGAMHLRTLLNWLPLYKHSRHIVQNERTVTLFEGKYRGASLPACVVQIGSRGVHAIDSDYNVGDEVQRGAIFRMIRIGSQVALIIPAGDDFTIRVRPGDTVRAGEAVLIHWAGGGVGEGDNGYQTA
jgi:phosphatidylserine decarboxylase